MVPLTLHGRGTRRIHLAFGAVVVLSCPGCQVACVDVVRWVLGYNLYVVSEGLAYRSRQPDVELLDYAVKVLGVRTVINLRGENPGEPWYDMEAARLGELEANLINIPMSASRPPSPQVLLSLYEAFQSCEYPILIHCQGGADRTGAAAAIWRMTMLGTPREEALGELDCRYGHLREFTPAMDWLAEVFVPDADWITTQYDPNAFYAAGWENGA